MKKQYLFLLCLICFLSFIPFSYAKEFEYEYKDGNKYTLNYEIINGDLINANSFNKDGSLLFDVSGSNGEIILTIPKTVPVNPDGNQMIILQNGEQIFSKKFERSCSFDISVGFDGESQIEFITGSITEGISFTYFELPEKCLDDPTYNTEIQREINTMDCMSFNHKKYLNARKEAVCISDDSFPILYQRGYLITSSILK